MEDLKILTDDYCTVLETLQKPARCWPKQEAEATPHSAPFSCWVLMSTVPVLVPLLSGSDLPEGKL